MNKYLAKRIELAKELEEEFNKKDYEIFTELEIANELEGFIGNEEFDIALTDEEQENVIEIIYDIYIDSDSDVSTYTALKAVLKTIEEFGSYLEFKGKYETEYSKTYDKIIYKL